MQAIKKEEGMEDTDPEAQELLQQYAANAGMETEQLAGDLRGRGNLPEYYTGSGLRTDSRTGSPAAAK